MMEPTRPWQFSLTSIFGLITLIGVLLWLVPVVASAPVPFAACYTVVGLVQLLCVPIVLHRFRRIGLARARPNEQPYELALLGAFFTLDTWVLMVAWIVCFWAGINGFWPLGLVLSLALVGVLLHLPTLCLQLLGLFVMPDWGRDRPLTALFFLNISNTLLVFGIVTCGAGWLLSFGLGAPG